MNALTIAIAAIVAVEAIVIALLIRRWRASSRRNPVRLRREASVGTLLWRGSSIDGKLDSVARFEYQALLLRRFGDLFWWIVGSQGWHRRRPMPVVKIERPDGEFARRVEERWKKIEPEWLRNHSLRTYALAVHYGTKRGYAFDERVLWGAALLHDIGLAESIAADRAAGSAAMVRARTDICFTLASAAIAEEIAAASDPIDDNGPEFAERVSEAILLHLNPAVSKSLGIEAWLLHVATLADVTGLGFHKLYSSAIDRIYAACPLLDQQSGARAAWASEVDANPSCRVAAMPFARSLFSLLVRRSPVYELYSRASRELLPGEETSKYVDIATSAANSETEEAESGKDVSAGQGKDSTR